MATDHHDQTQHHAFVYGGQAVLEGVMILGLYVFSVAARRPDGVIKLRSFTRPGWAQIPLRRVPVIRGVVVMAEMLTIGVRALTYSAQVAAGDEDTEQPIPAWSMALTLLLALALGAGLFVVAPLLVTTAAVDRFTESAILSNLAEGVIRLAIFLAYVVFIGLTPSIRRVFAYHAAEHMAVHAMEAGLALQSENVRRFPAAHPRCGTAFLLTVMLVSILVFALLGTPDLPLRILSRILLMPVIAGISYEIIRFNARHSGAAVVRALAAPSLALQALTTRKPDDGQIEVAIAAMNGAIEADRAAQAA